MSEKICKIVYFDEDSVTDYIQIMEGGELKKTTELLKTREASENQKFDVKAKAGISGVFKALLGWEASAGGEVSAELGFRSDKMVKNIIKNTILTDFLNIVDDCAFQNKSVSRLNNGAIKKLSGYTISVEKNSLSYMVMVSPYLTMFKSGTSIPTGEFDIAIDKLEKALKNAKGYYEFVGKKGKSEIVLRFNINSFRNSYTISDLLKMNLTLYAVKVGRTSLDMLNVNNELDMDINVMTKDNPSYIKENDEKGTVSTKQVDVFDVLLAGVESID